MVAQFLLLHTLFHEDPLNSGDDVIEQDIPDLFDTDNVIVCQYDKVGTSQLLSGVFLLVLSPAAEVCSFHFRFTAARTAGSFI